MKTTRDIEDLEWQIKQIAKECLSEYQRLYPDKPRPIITCTYRDAIDQEKAYKAGTSKARFGQSLHNYYPALAFDIAFVKSDNTLDWGVQQFKNFAKLAKGYGLEWGGDWKGFVDNPHFQLPMTWQDAKAGKIPRVIQSQFTLVEIAERARDTLDTSEAITFIKTLIKLYE